MINTINLIIEAMESQHSIGAYYNSFYRKFSPYKLGSKKGIYHCLGYQYGGKSKSGSIITGSRNNWRCFRVDKLKKIEILEEGFYKPKITPWSKQTCIDSLIKEVKF